MKNIILLVLIFLTTNCGPFLINENEYRILTESDKNIIKPFNIELLSKKIDNTKQLYLYEINTNDLKSCTKSQKYTWVHLWRPFCQSEYCQNINYFQNIEQNLKNYNLKLLLISESYDINSIKKAVNNSVYNKPIFVLQDSYYGHKMRTTKLKFNRDFEKTDLPKSKIWFDDYLFNDTILIFAGEGLNEQRIDSLILNYR